MSIITIAEAVIPNWHGRNANLYILPDKSFVVDGEEIQGGKLGYSESPINKWAKKVVCVAEGETLTIPEMQLYSTTDSDDPTVRYKTKLFSGGNEFTTVLGLTSFQLPASPTSTTWKDIREANLAGVEASAADNLAEYIRDTVEAFVTPGVRDEDALDIDHGGLVGLSDDDHPQYLDNARGDLRYDALGAASSAVSAHAAAADPHAQYLKESDAAATYTTQGELDNEIAAREAADTTLQAAISAKPSNGAGANVIPKSNGANLVASRITDDGTSIQLNSTTVHINSSDFLVGTGVGSVTADIGPGGSFFAGDASGSGSGIEVVTGAQTTIRGYNGEAYLQVKDDDPGIVMDAQYVAVSNLWPVLGDRGGAPPAANASFRGLIWHVRGGAGVADTVLICVKKADNTYAWLSLI